MSTANNISITYVDAITPYGESPTAFYCGVNTRISQLASHEGHLKRIVTQNGPIFLHSSERLPVQLPEDERVAFFLENLLSGLIKNLGNEVFPCALDAEDVSKAQAHVSPPKNRLKIQLMMNANTTGGALFTGSAWETFMQELVGAVGEKITWTWSGYDLNALCAALGALAQGTIDCLIWVACDTAVGLKDLLRYPAKERFLAKARILSEGAGVIIFKHCRRRQGARFSSATLPQTKDPNAVFNAFNIPRKTFPQVIFSGEQLGLKFAWIREPALMRARKNAGLWDISNRFENYGEASYLLFMIFSWYHFYYASLERLLVVGDWGEHLGCAYFTRE